MHNQSCSVHTGGKGSVEVPVGRWTNLYGLQKLPAGVQLWSDFLQDCGRFGVLDVLGQTAVEPQSASIDGTCAGYLYMCY
jgi:hypothetical protein